MMKFEVEMEIGNIGIGNTSTLATFYKYAGVAKERPHVQ